jgi:5,10-methylenetetrahydromethanopterin reductase
MLELAGRITDGTSVGSCGPRTIATHIVPRITAAAERAGRPRPRVLALVGVCITHDLLGLREHGRQKSALYDSFPSYRAALDREGVDSGADLILAGTADDILEGLAEYADAGTTDLRIVISARTEEERLATREFLAASIGSAVRPDVQNY